MQEIWKDIENYEGIYQVSNLGNVKSFAKNKIKFLIPQLSGSGYLRIGIKGKHYLIHRLVAKAFIPNPQNKPQVNHINGIKTDNRVKNLEWVTQSENQKHSYAFLHCPTMLNKFGHNHVASKKIMQFSKDNIFIKEWASIIEASKALNIPSCCITNCAKGRNKSSHNFIWKYKV